MTDAVFAPPGTRIAFHFTKLGSIHLSGGTGLVPLAVAMQLATDG
jgi:hypothetical protein